MAKRKYRIHVHCTHPGGCDRSSFYEAETRDEEAKIRKRYENKWLCVRHTAPEEVLSASNRKTIFEAVSSRSEKYPDLKNLFFDGRGFLYGPGFKIYPDDFPAGTRLIVTAEVVLPADTPTRKDEP